MQDDNIIPFRARPEPPQAPKRPSPPMINLPFATKILAGILIAVHLSIFVLKSTVLPEMENSAIFFGAFTPANWTSMESFQWLTPLTLITFSILHGGWLHLAVNILMLVAVGSGLERTLGKKDFLIIYIGGTLFAALAHLAFAPFSTLPIIGASGGVSALFGGMIYLSKTQQENYTGQSRSILPIVAIWIGIAVIGGFLGAPNGSPVAWIAHIGGFLAGIGLMMTLLKRRG